jgi:hypothetical protein
MEANLSSVSLLPCERIAAITAERFLLLKTSAMRRSVGTATDSVNDGSYPGFPDK